MSGETNDSKVLSLPAKFLRCARLSLSPRILRKLGTLVSDGYLAETGWVRSVIEDKIIDQRGAPRPWATLPYIDFVEQRLQPGWRIFEYGAGFSTRYYAGRVKEVVAVEHDKRFAESLVGRLPPNASVIYRGSAGDYVSAINDFRSFDVVCVDGIERQACLMHCLTVLNTRTVIVLDDSERFEYSTAQSNLLQAGYKRVDFWGIGPNCVRRKCTTIFYRAENVLGL